MNVGGKAQESGNTSRVLNPTIITKFQAVWRELKKQVELKAVLNIEADERVQLNLRWGLREAHRVGGK